MKPKSFVMFCGGLMLVATLGYSARHQWTQMARVLFEPALQVKVIEKRPRTQDAVIKMIVRKHLGEVKACYDQRLKMGLNKNGQLKVSWHLDQNGKPSDFQLIANDLEDPDLYECSVGRISNWKFPKGIPFNVNYTFHLKQKVKRDTASVNAIDAEKELLE